MTCFHHYRTAILSFPDKSSDESFNEGDKWCCSVEGTVAVAPAPFVLTVAGFTTGHAAAGSLAAGIQSVVYGSTVASTSVFAGLQSVGAAGLGATAASAVFTGGAGKAAWIKNKMPPCNDEPKCSSDEQ